MSNELLKDTNGKPSSKRICGIILIAIGVGYLLTVGIMSIIKVIADPQTSLAIGQTFIGLGSALIGIGVIEKLGNSNNG